MKKFENITVLHLDDLDYTNQELLPEIIKATDAADIVFRGKKIVKNRLACASGAMTETNSQQDDYEGICLEPDSFVLNIYHLLHAAQLLQSSRNPDIKISGDEILNFACEYSKAAAEKELAQ